MDYTMFEKEPFRVVGIRRTTPYGDGNTLGNVWQRINNEFLPQSKYKKCGLPTIEKYVSWDEAADQCDVEIWIPVAVK